MMENNFNKLFNNTKEHIDNKIYLYRAEKKKKGKTVKDRNGKIELNDATPHKNVILSLAFNIALENYQNIRPKTSVKKLDSLNDISDLLLRYFSNKFYNDIENIKTENKLIDSEQNYQYAEIEDFRNIEYKIYGTIERFRNYHSHHIHEPGILTFEDFFKNDKNLSTEDFNDAKNWFLKRFDDAYNHLTQSLKNRKEKLKEEKESANNKKCKEIDKVLESFSKIHFFKDDNKTISLDGRLFMACMFLYKRQAKIILDKWRNVKNAEGYANTKYTFFTYYCLSEKYSLNNYNDNLLKFRDITSKLSTIPYHNNPSLEFIYSKIREINEINYKKIETEETEPNTISVQNRNKDNDSLLLKKRQTKKTLIDVLKSSNKGKFKRALKEINEEILKLEKTAETNYSKSEELQKKIMPIRKRHILTQVLLQYIIDNNLIENKNIKIAVKKTPTDILNYYQINSTELDNTKNLTFLKNKIKNLEKNSTERKILNNHLKELKRNFVFRTINELKDLAKPQSNNEANDYKPPKGYNFTLKKKNALIQITHNNITSNITLSPQLLLKVVFIHLVNGNNSFSAINTFIENQIERLTKSDVNIKTVIDNFFRNPNNKNLKGKIFPKSLRKNSNETVYISKETLNKHIENRIEKLNKFYTTNSLQPKPWKYEAKRKIDTILNYMHFCLLQDVYSNQIHLKSEEKKPEDFIRHNYFNMTTYNIAREYFRYFGRYKAQNQNLELQQHSLDVVEDLKTKYTLCFSYINTQIKYANSLEELFDSILKKQIEQLENLKENIDKTTNYILLKILKINTSSNTDNVDKIYKEKFYAKSFALPAELISIEKECSEAWATFKTEKEKTLNGKEFRCTDFSFIRNYLQKQDVNTKTNIDFILQHIIPKTGIKKIPNNTFKQLLKIKTEELILWEVAKHYWLKANNEAYKFTVSEKDISNSSYQLYCSFNKVYNRILDYKITIDTSFWFYKNGKPSIEQNRFKSIIDKDPDITKKTISFNIKVPARKYDNKFLSVESKLIKEFCLFNLYDIKTSTVKLNPNYKYKNKIYNLQEYESLLKIIYSQLRESIVDIGLVLNTEKKVIDSKKEDFLKLLEEKYKEHNTILDFYIAFTNDNILDKKLYETILEKRTNKEETIIKNYLKLFRNYALHYQLQDKDKKQKVKKFLENLTSKDYITKEV